LYRSALIGCGRIGANCGAKGTGSSMIKSHAEVYKNCELTELVAVCDSDAERVDQCKSKWGVSKGYKQVNELLENESLDLISICTSSETHIPILNEILKKNSVKGILLEKPAGVNLQEIQKTIEIAKSSSISVQVNHIRRFPPVYRQIAQDLRQGKLGNIQHVSAFYTKGIINNGTHLFDLLRLFFGEPTQISLLSPRHDGEADPTLSGRVKFAKGLEAYLFGLNKKAYTIFEIDIIGTKERLLLSDQGHTLKRFSLEQGSLQKHGFQQLQLIPQIKNTDLSNSIKYALENLIESIELKCSPLCTMQDGYASMALSLKLVNQFKKDF
jgi:predicted dehydrogenase